MNTMRFVKRFRSSGVGLLLIAADSHGLPTADFHWRGSRPPFVEIIQWAKDCFEEWANKFNRRVQFVAIFREGVCECWEFTPGARPQRLCRAGRNPPLRDALKFAHTVLSSTKADKNISPIGGAQ